MDNTKHSTDGTSKPALEWFWVGFVVALCLGISIVFYGTDWVKGNIESTLTTLFVGLMSVVIMSLLLFSFRKRIFNYFKLKGSVRIQDLVDPFSKYVAAIGNGNIDDIKYSQRELSITAASWYSWISLRNFIVHTAIVLLGAMLGLGGVFLLKEQNSLISKQNKFFQEQIEGQDRQWRVQQRSTLLATLYDKIDCQLKPDEDRECPLKASIRARREAAVAFVELERDRIVKQKRDNIQGDIKSNIIDTSPDLAKVNLSRAILNEVKWNDVNLFEAKLFRVSFVGASLENANITSGNLKKADFSSANMRGVIFSMSSIDDAEFVSTDLRGADFQWVNSMKHSSFIKSDIRGANFSGANLEEVIYFPEHSDGCKQLKEGNNWSKTYRPTKLSCGGKIPKMSEELQLLIQGKS